MQSAQSAFRQKQSTLFFFFLQQETRQSLCVKGEFGVFWNTGTKQIKILFTQKKILPKSNTQTLLFNINNNYLII